MIEYIQWVDKEGRANIKCSGHSGTKGTSLICAAVSTLMWAGNAAVCSYEGSKATFASEDGYSEMSFFLSRETRAVLRVVWLGMHELAEQYPNEVAVYNAMRKEDFF